MFQLSFNQKVAFGFGFIIVLMLTSGLSSLWNLNHINESTSRVNQTAVPVVKESNQVQIQLLKLAKLSSLAFNAEDSENIRIYQRKFTQGVKEFENLYGSLEELAQEDPDMKALVIGIKSNYDFYRFAVTEMFEAKTLMISANESMREEANELFNMADALGGALVDLQYFMADSQDTENMELVAGFANQADTNALGILKTIEEVNDYLKLSGFELNTSGGEIKGNESVCLKQSSTMANLTDWQFSDRMMEIRTCFYEFAERFVNPETGKLYQGFVAASADKIFESTNAAAA